MREGRPVNRWLAAIIVGLTCLALWPSIEGLTGTTVFIDAPLGPSLRVPFGAAFLRVASPLLESGDRVLDVSIPVDDRLLSPRNRTDLYQSVRSEAFEGAVRLHVVRSHKPVLIEASMLHEPGWRRAAREWPTLFLGIVFLLFGMMVALTSPHPVATPLFAVSWCLGTASLSRLDLLIPEESGLLGVPLLSPRLGFFAMMMMPATILHLAMRFPVVARRFRKPAVAAVPYAFWLAPAAFAQIHLEDAALLNSMERIAVGATFISAAILAAASVTYARAMTPIERARTRALLLGLGLGSAAPLVFFLSGGRPPPGMRTLLILSPLIFPAAISWAIVRYRLLDPPLWLQRTVLTSLTAAVSLLLAMAAVTGAFALLDPSGSFAPGEAIPIALTTTILYQAFQSGLKRTAGGRLLPERSFEAFLDEATRVLANVTRPSEVLQRITSLLTTHLDASGVECFSLAPGAAEPTSPLARQGVALWRSGGSPRHRLVRARARSEDPAPDLAELVIPLSPESGPRALVTLASRRDGLPYTDQQERMLESLLHVATTALDAAATAEDLGLRVNEKTASLERALSDRKHVLAAARTICEAERPEEILACVEDFPAAEGGHVSWEDAWESDRGDRLMSRLSIEGQPDRFLLVEALPPERLADLRPQLETLCTFARLAHARLELLSELKREVDRQAAEIADITSRRLHAEFVRGVAHELRKPTEEVRQRVEVLLQGGSDAQEQTLARIRVATQEMSRRLDLLLFHSGLRLDRQRIDLVRVIDDAIHGARVMCPDRDFQVDHERSRLPMIGDPTRLLSVIENLLDNAIHATREGQRIAIRTWIERQDSGEGSWACLEVEDEGTGIQEEHIEQIFEPGIGFTPSGFGLGLSLCRAIVRMHGGRIATQSQPGRTIFRVHLPQFPHIPEESESDDSCHPAG